MSSSFFSCSLSSSCLGTNLCSVMSTNTSESRKYSILKPCSVISFTAVFAKAVSLSLTKESVRLDDRCGLTDYGCICALVPMRIACLTFSSFIRCEYVFSGATPTWEPSLVALNGTLHRQIDICYLFVDWKKDEQLIRRVVRVLYQDGQRLARRVRAVLLNELQSMRGSCLVALTTVGVN